MNIGEIKTVVRTALGRGNSLDEMLDIYIKNAIMRIERRRPWYYMFSTGVVNYNPLATNPERLQLDGVQIRNVEFVRRKDRTIYYSHINPKQVIGLQSSNENAYWLENGDTIVFAYDFAEAFALEFGYYKMSAPSSTDSWENWLTKNGADIIIGEVLTDLGNLIRNNEFAQMYIVTLERNASSLEQMDDDMRYANKQLQMR